MKTGVSTFPCASSRVPARAAPSVVLTVNFIELASQSLLPLPEGEGRGQGRSVRVRFVALAGLKQKVVQAVAHLGSRFDCLRLAGARNGSGRAARSRMSNISSLSERRCLFAMSKS